VAKLYNNEKTNAIFLSDVKKVFLYIKKGLYKKMNTTFLIFDYPTRKMTMFGTIYEVLEKFGIIGTFQQKRYI